MTRSEFKKMIEKLSFDSLTKELLLNAYDMGVYAGRVEQLNKDIETISNAQGKKEYADL